jgi:DNA methylase
MDWRHMAELLVAGEQVFAEFKNLCVWNKTNGGMGTFYRSKHELVFVFEVGSAPHLNTFGLETGRYRTNVWDYPGVNSFRAGRMEELALHPTVKPVALVADAIKDCSRRGDIVLDPFGGSGTTLIAAQKSGRRARLIELTPPTAMSSFGGTKQRPEIEPCLRKAGRPSRILWSSAGAQAIPTAIAEIRSMNCSRG